MLDVMYIFVFIQQNKNIKMALRDDNTQVLLRERERERETKSQT